MDPTYDPVGAMTSIECACCGQETWIEFADPPLCENCEDHLGVLHEQIEQLKAELAKFHKCNFDEDGMATACDGYGVNHHSVQVWHKNG